MMNTTDIQPEGKTTRAIEERTSKAPSALYLGFALASIAASATLMALERAQPYKSRFGFNRGILANFVGQWAPTILIMGLYNKLVKLEREMMATPT